MTPLHYPVCIGFRLHHHLHRVIEKIVPLSNVWSLNYFTPNPFFSLAYPILTEACKYLYSSNFLNEKGRPFLYKHQRDRRMKKWTIVYVKDPILPSSYIS